MEIIELSLETDTDDLLWIIGEPVRVRAKSQTVKIVQDRYVHLRKLWLSGMIEGYPVAAETYGGEVLYLEAGSQIIVFKNEDESLRYEMGEWK